MDTLLQTYKLADIEADLENYQFMNVTLNNVTEELNETADVNSNIDNRNLSVGYTYEIDDSVDVKFNYPDIFDLAMPMDTLIMDSRPIIKPEMRVMLEKLPKHILSTSSIYCPVCLLALDSNQLNLKKIAESNCICHANTTDEQRKKIESKHSRRANTTKEQRKKKAENSSQYYTNLTKEKRKKKIESKHKRRTNVTEEQQKKEAENSEIKIALKKLPEYVSSASLKYCPTCLLDFKDSDRFNIHLNLNIHNTNECSTCCTNYENGTKLWEHINSVHIDDFLKKAKKNKRTIENVRRLRSGKEIAELSDVKSDNVHKCPADLIEERKRKVREYHRKWRANLTEEQRNKIRKKKLASVMTDEQRKKVAEYNRKYHAKMSDEQRNKSLEYHRKRNANSTEEFRKKKAEWNRKWYANRTEEKRKKKAEYDHIRGINMTEEQRKRKSEMKRKWFANLTEEQRKKRAEQRRNRKAKMKTFDVSPLLLNVILSEGASSPNT